MVLLLNTTTKPEPELTGTSGSVLKKDQKAQKVKKTNDFI